MGKVYRFYRRSRADDTAPIYERYPLHAVTNSKKLAKKFMEQRNMDKFLLKKSSMDESEMLTYLRSKRDKELIDSYMETIDQDGEIMYAKFVMSGEEAANSAEYADTCQIVNIMMGGRGMVPLEIFSEKIREILANMNYLKVYEALGFFSNRGRHVDILDLDLEVDKFKTFLVLYQDYLADNFMKHVEFSYVVDNKGDFIY